METEDKKNSLITVKDAYQEVGTNYRHFLNWRHGILATYSASISALCVGSAWLYEKDPCFLWLGFLAGLILTATLYGIDYRIRSLYHACLQAGQACEANLPENTRIYTSLNKLINQKITHTHVIDFICLVVSVTMLLGGFWSLWKCFK